MAAVLMDDAGTETAITEGRVKIGWSSCRIKGKDYF